MIGEGEGASGFGYGFYFSENIDDAKEYARKLEREKGEKRLYKVKIPNKDQYLNIDKDLDEQSEYIKNKLLSISDKNKIKIVEYNGFNYTKFKNDIDDNPEEYEFKNNTVEYNAFFKDILDTEFMNIGNQFYSILEQITGSEYSASKFLYEHGIKGNIHYTFHYLNYVVFSEDDITILKKTKPIIR